MMCAALAGVLLMIERLNKHPISIEPLTGAHAEEGITARVQSSPVTIKNQAESNSESKPIDKNDLNH